LILQTHTHTPHLPHTNIKCTPIIFVFQNTKERKELKDPAKDPQYSETLIDSIRAQKDQVQDKCLLPLYSKILTAFRYLSSSNL